MQPPLLPRQPGVDTAVGDWLIVWRGVCVGVLFVLLMLYTRSIAPGKR